jgi:hypothetical protein
VRRWQHATYAKAKIQRARTSWGGLVTPANGGQTRQGHHLGPVAKSTTGRAGLTEGVGSAARGGLPRREAGQRAQRHRALQRGTAARNDGAGPQQQCGSSGREAQGPAVGLGTARVKASAKTRAKLESRQVCWGKRGVQCKGEASAAPCCGHARAARMGPATDGVRRTRSDSDPAIVDRSPGTGATSH